MTQADGAKQAALHSLRERDLGSEERGELIAIVGSRAQYYKKKKKPRMSQRYHKRSNLVLKDIWASVATLSGQINKINDMKTRTLSS